MHHNRRFLAAFALCSVVLAGCSMFGGGESGVRHAEDVRVAAPADWKEQDKYDADRAFRTPTGGVVTFVSSCQHRDQATPELRVKHLLFGTRNVRYLKREPLKREDYDGLRTSVRATMDGVAFFLEIAVLQRESCVFDFTMMNRREIPAGEIVQFTAFVQSFPHGKN